MKILGNPSNLLHRSSSQLLLCCVVFVLCFVVLCYAVRTDGHKDPQKHKRPVSDLSPRARLARPYLELPSWAGGWDGMSRTLSEQYTTLRY